MENLDVVYEWTVCKSNPLYFISKYCNSVELYNPKHGYVVECLRNGKNTMCTAITL